MPCTEISADWAAQRIKGLSLTTAIKNALIPDKPKSKQDVIKTLIDSFRYPRKGPGMLWEECTRKVRAMGGKVELGQRVTGCTWDAKTKTWTVKSEKDGKVTETVAHHVISSAPLRELAHAISPAMSDKAMKSADSLKYRDFLTVVLIQKDKNLFDDNWIYIHDPSVKVGRVQNFKSWSPEMIPDPDKCCYGLEYFCFEGDGLWSSSDDVLIDLAKRELEQIGLGKASEVLDGCVVRQKKAYPVYDDDYTKHVDVVRAELDERFPTLHPVGRNGMHKYNNQDHAMMTAMLTVQNILADKRVYDVWHVNQDAEYHEAGNAGAESTVSGLRQVPTKARSAQETAASPNG
jgi:protoporphyrinogen oxidase